MGKVGNIDHLEGKARLEVFAWGKGERTLEWMSDRFKGLVTHLDYLPGGERLLMAGGAGDGFLSFFDVKAKKPLREEKVDIIHTQHQAAIKTEANSMRSSENITEMSWTFYKLGFKDNLFSLALFKMASC
jgi:hypothetical protein